MQAGDKSAEDARTTTTASSVVTLVVDERQHEERRTSPGVRAWVRSAVFFVLGQLIEHLDVIERVKGLFGL